MTNTHNHHDLPPTHWREVHDPHSGRLLRCRPIGSPAGSWPHTPWWHCVFHDPYERINFWSHAIPGAFFFFYAIYHFILNLSAASALFAACACCTHLSSSLTHVYPDDHKIEKLDHIGITATIIGTPVSALLAKAHGHLPTTLKIISVELLLAAFMRPVPRVIGFVSGGAAMVFIYGRQLADAVFALELVLYLGGALLFLRNDGHSRGIGFSDHHLLHYFVTVASVLHLYYLKEAER